MTPNFSFSPGRLSLFSHSFPLNPSFPFNPFFLFSDSFFEMSSSPCLLPLLLSFLVTLWNSPFVTPLNNEEEAIALLSFKHSITEDPLGSLSNWTNSSQDPCSWNGITCKDQSVTSITIPNKKLSGILSPSLGSLPHLRHVNLRNNRLSGNLPPDLFKPEGIQSLVLYGNSFSGPLPSEVGTLQFLQTLDLSQNSLNGPLPGSLVQCKRLRNLDLSKNNFSGYLPDGFGKSLTLMEKLDLSFNGFTGSIPSDLGYLANLEETLDLSHNLFNGSIPASLGNLPEKVYIDLTHNNLTGPIPQTGALMNRGPTAFIGNPGLCGPPLKILCSSTDGATGTGSFPYLPSNYPPEDGGGAAGHGGGLSRAAVIAIVIGDVVGICVIGLVFSYCYSRMCRGDRSGGVAAEGGRCDKGSRGRKECFCFRKDESETLSENAEHYDLVALDTHVAFDLDELLKASAFVLGKSGIGIVYKVVLEDGLTLAVRRLGEGGSQRLKEFQTEVEAIGKLRHRNVVTLKAYYWSADEKLLIYEFLPNGNLSSAVHGKPGLSASAPLPWPVRLKIIKGIARGLLYLHDYSPKKYVHGDLKPSNVLLGHDMEPKIADFGLGRLANIAGSGSPISSALDMAALASGYQAPESLKAAKPSQKWDVYSYGVILLELLTGRPPLVAVGGTEVGLVQWMQLCIEEKKPVSEVLDPSLALHADKEDEMIAVLKVAMACTQSGPERRLSMRQVVDALERV